MTKLLLLSDKTLCQTINKLTIYNGVVFMKTAYHEFYKDFKCIADKCPDSCCKEWDVVVDDDSYIKYKNADGAFGEKLRSVMTIDADGDRIFTLNNNRCPFWNKDMLCDIYINMGENALCETCKRFPRITLDYSQFQEKILSLACPEALRLMLKKGAMDKIITAHNGEDAEPCDYDFSVMQLLLGARQKIFAVLKNTDNDIFDCLNGIYQICLKVQSEFDGICYKSAVIAEDSFIKEYGQTVNLLLQLDIMTAEWKHLLTGASKYKPNKDDILKFREYIRNYEHEYKNLIYYYIFRYFLNSIDSYDVTECFDLTALAVKSAYILQMYKFAEKGSLTADDRHRIIGLYSKEVEHSYENIEFLRDIK